MEYHWIPEDDFLLRKSMENGASLESLAKGAIKFSRKFTFSELKDRWHSLLYDPQVTSLSSSAGFDLQYSNHFLSQSHHQTTPIRSQYYAARKKRRLEKPLNDDNNNAMELDHQEHQEHVFSGCEFFDLKFDESDFEIFRNTFPDIMHQEEFQDPLPQSESYQEEFHDPLFQPESHQDLQNKEEEYCFNVMSLFELDPHPETKNGVIVCTLNQVSIEIPDNDDIDFEMYKQKTRNSTSSSKKPPLPPTKGSSLSQATKGNDINLGDGFTDKATTTSLQQSLDKETLVTMMDVNTSMSEEEDLLSFSDVEAMILDMDLEPVGQDQYELQVSRYQNEEMARRIMRLEQSSKCYMNRDIKSHKAFALLYGSSKHYITKSEVLLGRATGEYPVDIDLGSSESGIKVSRRQALIKLKQDGCFEIMNLGKFSIWMNEKEIKHGEVVDLRNNSLIQIREMSFVFETNDKAIKRYLDGIRK